MKHMIVALIALVGISAQAQIINCEITPKGQAKQTLQLEAGYGHLPINLADGHTLEISFFGDDIRFSEIRPPSEAERAADLAARTKNGVVQEVYLAGMTVAYSQVRADLEVTLAMFTTEKVNVYCELVNDGLE